ncbi:TPA: hypothetical protein DDW35_08110, partial [Candidatus Sumerlaeota bacterium]|nr:hypothetical protein [Candidatus Sumerlaeota bacterium]
MDAQETTRQRVTSTMVALRAGVSQPTVSRVINNPRIVGGETVKRVWEAIRELGYSPAKSHALGLSNTHYPSEKFGAEFSCPPRYASAGVTAVMVAQRAGVSPATVSRVVNKRLVHPETVVRVRQAIEELGFVPSAPIAGRRRSSVKGNIALFCPDGKLEAMVRTPILNNVLHGVISALSERGLYLIQTTISDSHALLAKHEVDGIIVWPNLVGVPKAAIELLRTYPVVYVMSTPEARLPGDRVKPNNKLVGTLAAKHLLAQGHKRLACVSTTDLESWLWERSKAF